MSIRAATIVAAPYSLSDLWISPASSSSLHLAAHTSTSPGLILLLRWYTSVSLLSKTRISCTLHLPSSPRVNANVPRCSPSTLLKAVDASAPSPLPISHPPSSFPFSPPPSVTLSSFSTLLSSTLVSTAMKDHPSIILSV
ncbi:unnamed protein product [Closterium sp. NIES-54]